MRPRVVARRARRLATMPPREAAARVVAEAAREHQRVVLARARRGGGPLALGRVLRDHAPLLLDPGRPSVPPWAEAIAAARADAAWREAIDARATAAWAGRVEAFGDEPLVLPPPVDWHVDPRTGHGWPLAFHRRLDYVNAGRASDVKVPWEVARLRGAVALAQAAAVLDDGRSGEAAEAAVVSWIRANPVGYGIHWAVGMEVALRAVNLLCVDGLLRAAGHGCSGRPLRLASLLQHGWFLHRNVEWGRPAGNHYLADGVGLVWLGRALAGSGEADAWLARGRAIVHEAAERHVLADGADQEGSLPYHVLVLELFLTARAVDGGLAAIDPVLRRMARVAEAVADPADGTIPLLGDDDGGRVLALGGAPSHDARRVVALADALLDGVAPGPAGWAEDARWLVPHAAGSLRPAPLELPLHLPAAGLVVLGDARDRVLLDAGPVGFRGQGGHGHVDAMTVVAALGGRLAIPDSGTGSYTGDPVLRDELRSAAAHSVAIVDGRPYARPSAVSLWRLEGDAPPQLTTLSGDAGGQEVVAEQALPAARGAARHRRRLRWAPGVVAVEDRLEAPAGTEVALHVQLPHEPAGRDGDELRCGPFAVAFELPDGAVLAVEPVRRSRRYGSVEPAWRAVVRGTAPAGDALVVRWGVREVDA